MSRLRVALTWGRAVPAAAALAATAAQPSWAQVTFRLTPQASGTAALLQAVSAVNQRVVWVSGHGGTVLRSLDGGTTWEAFVVPGADSLQFRDLHAFDADRAVLLSAGPGDRSRIYVTADGGRSWTLRFQNADPRAFFDCLDFWDAREGVAFSDAVDAEFVLLRTADGGQTWEPIPAIRMPGALGGEGSFAASGACLVVRPPGYAWIGTGAAPQARVLRTADRGATWTVSVAPIVAGSAAGISALVFRDSLRGLALGGDFATARTRGPRVALTTDGGRSWRPAGEPALEGAIYGAAWVPGARAPTVVAVGPGGTSFSTDFGTTWAPLDTVAHWAVAFVGPAAGWAVGPRGRITKLTLVEE